MIEIIWEKLELGRVGDSGIVKEEEAMDVTLVRLKLLCRKNENFIFIIVLFYNIQWPLYTQK